MTQKEFEISSNLLHEIEHLQEVKGKLGRSTILSLNLRYYEERTKEYEDWTLELKHSYPVEEFKKTITSNLTKRIENQLRRFGNNIKRVINKENKEIAEPNL